MTEVVSSGNEQSLGSRLFSSLIERGEVSLFNLNQRGRLLGREGDFFPEFAIGDLAEEHLPFLTGMEDALKAISLGEIDGWKFPNISLRSADGDEAVYNIDIMCVEETSEPSLAVILWDVTTAAAMQQKVVHVHNTTALDNVSLVKQRDEAEQTVRTKSSFLANISHELRSPLTLALGNCDLLADQTVYLDDQSRTDCLNDIRDNAAELLEFVSELLDFSRAEAGQLSIADETVNLNEEFDRITRQMNAEARRLDIQFETEFPDQQIKIRGERRRVRQIMVNLLSNALKYTASGGTVSVALSRNHDQSVVFSVKDNGVGMTSEEVETVGTPFLKFEKQPLHNEMNANGLGLALTLQLIQVHDGELLILSAPGEGTEAKVIFPQTRVLG